jgi:hypothetical protein
VRVQRLQDISEADAATEGIGGKDTITVSPLTTKTYREAFSYYWRSLTDKNWRTDGWDANPWVWALTFNVHHQNIDEFLKGREAA